MDFIGASLEIKTVDIPKRVISGYAAAHNNIDRVGDIIDPQASVKAVRRLGKPSDVGVFVGHDTSALPVGIPQVIQATPRGLYTETYILKGPAGDNLLAVAKDLQAHGHPLGMSIGYRTHDSRREIAGRKSVRRIMDYELKEYSFASHHAVANPEAVMTDVKARRKALSEGNDSAGGFLPQGKGRKAMDYRVEQRDGKYVVLCDADGDGDGDDNQVVGSYDDEATANAVVAALRRHADGDTDGVDGDGEMAARRKTAKAVWSTASQNDLPDSSFLYVEPGEKDEHGRTVPRSKRHFPYRDASGAIDLPHLRNAIARIPQSNLPDDLKERLQARARRLLEQHGGGDGKTVVEPEEWKTGAPLAIRALGYRLLDLSDAVAEELRAMALLGEETKSYARVRPQMRERLAGVGKDLGRLVEVAAMIDRGEDGKARVAWLSKQLALTDV
jgi:phage head maturation protease